MKWIQYFVGQYTRNGKTNENRACNGIRFTSQKRSKARWINSKTLERGETFTRTKSYFGISISKFCSRRTGKGFTVKLLTATSVDGFCSLRLVRGSQV